MNIVANSIFNDATDGYGTRILYPVHISGIVYFADMYDCTYYDYRYTSGVIRTYTAETGSSGMLSIENKLLGISPIFDGKCLSVVSRADSGVSSEYRIKVYDPSTSSWTTSVVSGNVFTEPLPFTFSVSGDSRYIFYADNTVNAAVVGIWDTVGDTYSKITTDNVSLTSGRIIIDMVLSNGYDPSNIGEVFVLTGVSYYCQDPQVFRYMIPTIPPYTGGSWTNITPTQISGKVYFSPQDPNDWSYPRCHTGLATVKTLTGTDDIFVKLWDNTKSIARYNMTGCKLPDDSVLAAGGYACDIYRSADMGSSWVIQNPQAWSSRYYNTLVCFNDGSSGTVLQFGGSAGIDLKKSTDGGVTWTNLPTPPYPNYLWYSALNVSGSAIMLCGTNTSYTRLTSVWKSNDFGSSWVQTGNIPGARSEQWAAVMPDQSMVVGCGYSRVDCYRSTDYGATWTLKNASVPFGIRCSAAAWAVPDGANGLLCVTMGDDTPYGYTSIPDVWVSADYGVNWVKRSTVPLIRNHNNPTAVVISGTTTLIYGGGYYLEAYYSDDMCSSWHNTYHFHLPTPYVYRNVSGSTWEQVGTFPTPDYSDQSWFNDYHVDHVFKGTISGNVICVTSYDIENYNESGSLCTFNMFTSSADMTSSWANVGMPNTDTDQIVWDFAETGGSTNYLYMPFSQHIPVEYSNMSGAMYAARYNMTDIQTSGDCVITNAVPGDIYNIGGISGDPTTHIEFTMWKNSMYGE